MVEGNEVITMLLGLGVLVFIMANHAGLTRFPYSIVIRMGFYVLFMGWVLTIAEGFFAYTLLNYLEHVCFAISSILLAVWCWKVFYKEGIRG